MNDIDLNQDGVIQDKEISIYKAGVKLNRFIVYISLIAMIFSGGYMIVYASSEKIAALEGIITTWWSIFGAIIAGYMGTTVVESFQNRG